MSAQRKMLITIHSVAIAGLSLMSAFLLRFDFAVPESEARFLYRALWTFIAAKAVVFYCFGYHRGLSKLVGFRDLMRVFVANCAASMLAFAFTQVLVGPAFPRTVYVIDAIVCFLLSATFLFGRRMLDEIAALGLARGVTPRKRLLIYGAGQAGLMLAKEIRARQNMGAKVIGFVDDDPSKIGAALSGIPVLGTGRDAASIVVRQARHGSPVSEIVIAMPSATGRQMRDVIANCRAARVPFKTVPGLTELLDGKVLSRQIRDVCVNDLLGREPVSVSEQAIGQHVTGKIVMVTGGCGSIGSELCRQLARFEPKRLVIFDQAESEMFMLLLELRDRFPSLAIVSELGDIRRYARLRETMARHSVEAVFHAAAYKHVPLMEANVIEAALNNVIGTHNVLRAVRDTGVKRFLMISSDKAVNPTSIMGVTKRIGELMVKAAQQEERQDGCTFVSVRFGNVLASNGSVVEVFRRQIARGGPVTVTHPDMRRYFMSIPEAVQLVLQAFSMGNGGELFVLDMGEPVRISDLARNMIRLAGFTPDEDVRIEYTGLRPGEKLFEEVNTAAEDMLPTYHEKVKIFRSNAPPLTDMTLWLADLQSRIQAGNAELVRNHLLAFVPEYIGAQATPRKERTRAIGAAVGD